MVESFTETREGRHVAADVAAALPAAPVDPSDVRDYYEHLVCKVYGVSATTSDGVERQQIIRESLGTALRPGAPLTLTAGLPGDSWAVGVALPDGRSLGQLPHLVTDHGCFGRGRVKDLMGKMTVVARVVRVHGGGKNEYGDEMLLGVVIAVIWFPYRSPGETKPIPHLKLLEEYPCED